MELDFDFNFDFADWNPNCTTQDGVAVSSQIAIEQRAMKRYTKNLELHLVKAKALDDLCIAPIPGEQWRIITEKQFNAFALILSVFERKDVIDELCFAIYRINEPAVTALIEMIDSGRIRRACFIISNFFNQTKRPEKWAKMLKNYCEEHPDTCSMAFVHNHSKVVCIHSGDDYYVMEGSGNMSDNARIEQYVYENDKRLFDFHKSWMRDLVEGK